MKQITGPITTTVLVNKEYYLPSDYIPDNLELISNIYANDNKYMVDVAKTAFEKLSQDAAQLGYRIIAVSTYRDYDYQKNLYAGYVKDKGQEYADQVSARPGHSEHQTGLAVDVEGSNRDYDYFEDAKEFPWMRDNAHKYGFILRYPKGKEHITGFKFEPWHYRYVGLEPAQIMYEENLTLEEFHQKYDK